MKINFNFAPDTKVTLKANDQSETVDLWSHAHKLLEGHAGRINVYDAPLSAPSAGTAVARTDGKTTLNLLDMKDAGEINASLSNDRKALIRAGKPQQAQGHPSGEHYWLPIKENDRFVCEPGQRHRTIYVAHDGMTKAQIAAHATAAGTATTEAQVNGTWLVARPQYGGSPELAFSFDVFNTYRSHVQYGSNTLGRSDHYLFKRGGDYTGPSGTDNLFYGMGGEDELHPLYFGAYGTGPDPIFYGQMNWGFAPYVVVEDIQFRENSRSWYGYAAIYNHVNFHGAHDISNASFMTMREVKSDTLFLLTPKKTTTNAEGDVLWLQNGNHMGGYYSDQGDRLLVDSCIIDHSGWAEGYDYNLSADYPQPVSKYSHGIYYSAGTLDASFRDNLISRSASGAYQLRAGAQIEGNLLLDNNLGAAVNSFAGVAQFNNITDSIVTSAGYRLVAYENGAFDWGYDVNGPQSSMVGNIITHHANPDDPAELATKKGAEHTSYESAAKLYNDTQVWHWGNKPNVGVDGISATTLNQTTIQRYTGSLIGQPAGTIQQFIDYAYAADSVGDVVRDAVDWFKGRFGTPRPARTTPADLVFQPDSRLEGFRWDNRYNWSTKDLPGRNVADTVDLAGNFVKFGNVNANVASLQSRGGILDVVSGKLEVGAVLDAADLTIRNAGQVWLTDMEQPLKAVLTGGRLSLTGSTANADLDAMGHAQVLLGADCTISVGKSLIVRGQRAQVGWDGTGTATLNIAGKLQFVRGMEIVCGDNMQFGRSIHRNIGKEIVGSVSGFRAKIASVNKWYPRGNRYKVWLTDVVGTPQANETFEVVTGFMQGDVRGRHVVTIYSIDSQGVAPIKRFRSGAIGNGLTEPTVTATVNLASTAQIAVPAGLASGTVLIGGDGVTFVNNGATLPAGVNITGGKLVFTA